MKTREYESISRDCLIPAPAEPCFRSGLYLSYIIISSPFSLRRSTWRNLAGSLGGRVTQPDSATAAARPGKPGTMPADARLASMRITCLHAHQDNPTGLNRIPAPRAWPGHLPAGGDHRRCAGDRERPAMTMQSRRRPIGGDPINRDAAAVPRGPVAKSCSDLRLDAVPDRLLDLHPVESRDLLQTRGRGDVDLGEVIANHVDPNKNHPLVPQGRPDRLADFPVPRGQRRCLRPSADMHVRPCLALGRNTVHGTHRHAVDQDDPLVAAPDGWFIA